MAFAVKRDLILVSTGKCAGDGAVPDIVITLAATDETAAVFTQDFSDFLFVLSHYAEILS